MFSTCLFCTSALGANAVIERFPVGRRLAFDAAKGRLWVVCRKCGRWNLSPLEERWEAIEECERRFRDTRLRVSTDQIGLARLAEGLELVRIGEPQRPEFAAWRYGDQFGRRRMRTLAITGGAIAVAGVMAATGSIALLKTVVPGGGLLWQLPSWLSSYRHQRRIVTTVPVNAMDDAHLRMRHVSQAAIVRHPEAGWALRVAHDSGSTLVTGNEALRVAGHVLAQLNQSGAFQRTVREAVRRLEAAGGPAELLASSARDDEGPLRRPRWTMEEGRWAQVPRAALRRLSAVDRLALEMATHEESEHAALEGELAALEAEWRDAEEIARIADDMFLPPAVDERLRRLRDER